jgi:glycogen debranching enzyme
MRVRYYALLISTLYFFGCATNESDKSPITNASLSIADLAITVDNTGNRPFSFTNKESAYFFTFTHKTNHPEWSWFEGLNVSRMRIMPGFESYVDNKALSKAGANVSVRPDFVSRTYPSGYTEEIWLYDYLNLVSVRIKAKAKTIGFRFNGTQTSIQKIEEDMLYFSPLENNVGTLVVAALAPNTPIRFDENTGEIEAVSSAKGFFISYAANPELGKDQVLQAQEKYLEWQAFRTQRLQEFIDQSAYIRTSSDSLNSALAWISLNLDQLVTRQQGAGIYAGLPWFNDYWGRDLFISLPGATLVNGNFKTARDILLSFARLQDKDPNSKTYGRVPNRARPDELLYNTTDGTPRFVIQAMEYVRYSGDESIIPELYEAVKRSVEGSLRNWTDENGFLTHEEADTWMDAKWEGEIPLSPRGNRANDIQALWVEQLKAAAWFANEMQDNTLHNNWLKLANDIQLAFETDFILPNAGYLADHLNADNTQDWQFRPNQLFALDMLQSEGLKASITKRSWNRLVYPWGVSSLDAKDPNFHPFHLAPEFYHKDYAYHNGTVWLWLNGIAMQRMIEFGQQDVAFRLFKNMNKLALENVGVGGLPENADAYPREGQNSVKSTGTFLQAWSNAEHLRIWYQYFIGFKPDAIHKRVRFTPALPSEIKQLETKLAVADGFIAMSFTRNEQQTKYQYINKTSHSLSFEIILAGYETQELEINPLSKLTIISLDQETTWTIEDKDGTQLSTFSTPIGPLKKIQEEEWAEYFDGVGFAKIDTTRTFKVLQN